MHRNYTLQLPKTKEIPWLSLSSTQIFTKHQVQQALIRHNLHISDRLTIAAVFAAASLARKVYLRQGVGVGAFRRQYGGRNKRKGSVPEHFAKASGGLIRHILIQLENEGLVEKYEGKKGGRKITSQGQRDLDLIAGRIQATEEPEEEEEDAE